MQANSEHSSEENLEHYSLGTLSESETEVFEEHLLICPSCQDRLTEMDAYVQAAQAAARKLRVRRSWGWPGTALNIPRLAWAFGAVFCLLLLLWVAGPRKSPITSGGPPVAVALAAVRGAEQAAVATAPAGHPLRLEADLAGLPIQRDCVMEVVDSLGKPAGQSQTGLEGSRLTMQLAAGLSAGRYWVRVYTPGAEKELLREYALLIQ
jgi:hypothetical protein